MQEKEGLPKRAVEALASMKLTLIIFFTLAAVSVVGTLFPHGMTGSEVHHHFSPTAAWIIETLGLHDLYRTTWFRLLLLLLCANLIVCTLQRLPKTLKLAQRREEEISRDKLIKFSQNFETMAPLSVDETQSALQRVFQSEFGSLRDVKGSEGYAGAAEKGRWSTFLVYVIHLSVLLVLLGALIGSMLGFKGIMNILEGEASASVMLRQGHERLDLPFSVRCDAFSVTFYEMGTPKEYRSDLTILEEGQEVLKRSIRVNDPLTYRGVTFYQSSYGSLLNNLKIEITDTDSGRTLSMDMKMRQPQTVPGSTDQLQVMDYREDIGRMGPAVAIAMLREGEEPTGAWILVKMPDFHGNRIGNYRFAVKEAETVWYTGLQVKSDPGVWMVYAGFSALLLGITLAYYMSHRRIWVVAEPHPGKTGSTRVTLAGRTNRNPVAFEEEFQKLCLRVEQELRASENKDSQT